MLHSKTDLLQLQALPLEDKVVLTERRVKAWYDHFDGDVYLSFSGGKDSTVLKDIIGRLYPDVPSVFVNTGLEYPEVRSFALHQKNVVRVDPKMHFYEVIDKYGYPVISKEQSSYIYEARTCAGKPIAIKRTNFGAPFAIRQKWAFMLDAPFKISDHCCDVMKKAPAKAYEKETGRRPFVATMTHESLLRETAWMQHGCNAFDAARPVSAPMSFWTEQDVLEYIFTRQLPIASVYGEVVEEHDMLGKAGYKLTGLQRTGCIFCCFGVERERESRTAFNGSKCLIQNNTSTACTV